MKQYRRRALDAASIGLGMARGLFYSLLTFTLMVSILELGRCLL